MAEWTVDLDDMSARDTLARLTGQFSFVTDEALARIIAGRPSGYVTPDLARALLEARRYLEFAPA